VVLAVLRGVGGVAWCWRWCVVSAALRGVSGVEWCRLRAALSGGRLRAALRGCCLRAAWSPPWPSSSRAGWADLHVAGKKKGEVPR
jgi:hypothetical protein